MKNYLAFIIGLVSINVCGQTKYEITGFSEKYIGVLIIEKGYENEVFKKGTISIIESSTTEKIIEIHSDELTFDLDENGDIQTNVLELPYGEQSILIYEDFNFDGKNDLAIMDGQYSCYHGPSFQIYLETEDGLKHSTEFTRLAQEYCGMFQTNHETKTIHTMTKSGCCWHQFSKFKVVNNIPKPILIIEEDATSLPFHSTTITEWNGDKKTEKIEKTIDLQQENITEILSFKLSKNQKKVILFIVESRILNYALELANKTIEFSYPIEITYNNPDFKVNKAKNKLSFKNENAVYKIYEIHKQGKIAEIGIHVEINGKQYDLKGDLNSIKGSLKNIDSIKLENIVSE